MKGNMKVLVIASLLFFGPALVYAQKARFTVGLLTSPDMLPTLVAEQAGHFSQEGLNVTLVVFRSGVQLMQSLIGGDTHIAMCSAPEFVQAVNAGAKASAVWGNSNLMPFALVSQPQIRTVNELKGKKIAVSSAGSLTDFLTRYVLKIKGIDPAADLTIMGIGGEPTRFAALQSGSVDAALINVTNFARAKSEGFNVLLRLSDLIPEWPLSLICIRDELLTNREPELRSFLSAYRKGVATAKKDPEIAILALQKKLKFDQQTAKTGYDVYVKSIPEDGHVAERGFELLLAQAKERGILKRAYTVSDFIDYRYIRQAQAR